MGDFYTEAQFSVLRGLNTGRKPGLIGEDQYAYAKNVSNRSGRIRIRPRMVRRRVLFAGTPQGATFFDHTGEILVSVGGHILRLEPQRNWRMRVMTSVSDRNSAYNPYAWFCETDGSLVIQDGRSSALVYDGASFGRNTGIPVGTVMAYGSGRLGVATGARYRLLQLGDIRTGEHQSELKFTETGYLNGGGALAFPTTIRSLAHATIVNTASGKGPLLVGLRKQLFSVRTDITTRDHWQLTDGFVTEVFGEHGIVGHDAYASVNQDVYFRALDGLRSVRLTVADYASAGATPLSREFSQRFDYDTEWMLAASSIVYFDNRLWFTHSPYLLDGFRPVHAGLGTINFDLLSEMGAKMQPAFESEHGCPAIVQLFAGDSGDERRCFALCREGSANTIWEILPERVYKLAHVRGLFAQDNPHGVLETRVFYGNDAKRLSIFRKAILNFSGLKGYASVAVKFRAEGASQWTDLASYQFQSRTSTVGTVYEGEKRGPILTGEASEEIDTVSQRPVNVGHGFQLRFEWVGEVEIGPWELVTEIYPEGPALENKTETETLVPITGDELPAEPVSPNIAGYLTLGDGTSKLDLGDGGSFLTLG